MRKKGVTDMVADNMELGPKEILQRIEKTWMIDPGKAHWHGDATGEFEAFSWWPGDHRVMVRANRDVEQTDTAIRMRIDTDFIRKLDVRSESVATLLGAMAYLYTSTYAWLYLPTSVQDEFEEKLPIDLDVSRVWLSSTAYVRPETSGWLPEFVAKMALLQPINAQIQAGRLAQALQAEAEVSSDPSDPHAPLDDILGVLEGVYAPIGKERASGQHVTNSPISRRHGGNLMAVLAWVIPAA